MNNKETSNKNDDKQTKSSIQKDLAQHIRVIFANKDIDQATLCRTIEERYPSIKVNSGTLSGYLSGKTTIPSYMLPILADVFGCSVSDFFSDINSISSVSKKSDPYIEFIRDDKYLTFDARNEAFDDLFSDFYCYFWPTAGGIDVTPQCGSLSFKSIDNKCRVKLCINDDTNEVQKQYEGVATISETLNACFCMLRGTHNLRVGDMCFIVFKHPHRNSKIMQCAIAEVVTISAGTDKKLPTSLRILITSEKLKEEDIDLIMPSLYMNSSRYIIDCLKLDKYSNFSDKEKKIIDILKNGESNNSVSYKQDCYCFTEDTINAYAARVELTKFELAKLISKLRSISRYERHNKVSSTATANVYTILRYLGYFSPKQDNK